MIVLLVLKRGSGHDPITLTPAPPYCALGPHSSRANCFGGARFTLPPLYPLPAVYSCGPPQLVLAFAAAKLNGESFDGSPRSEAYWVSFVVLRLSDQERGSDSPNCKRSTRDAAPRVNPDANEAAPRSREPATQGTQAAHSEPGPTGSEIRPPPHACECLSIRRRWGLYKPVYIRQTSSR